MILPARIPKEIDGANTCTSISHFYVYQSSDVTMEEIPDVQVTNKERTDDSPVAVFDTMVQTEKEENSSGDA
ncbi:hypothetical protein YC2023_071074 [Brassica napus]